MARIGFSRSLGYRADQAGLLVSVTNMPLTFQRTLMTRPVMDQAIVTGLSIAANHAVVALAQESLQAVALMLGRQARLEPDDARWSRTTLALDAAAIGVGLALQRGFRQHHREPLPRAGVRTAGYWLTLTGIAGSVIGGLQETVAATKGRAPRSLPVVIPAAAGLAGINAIRVRRAARLDPTPGGEPTDAPPAKALALGVAVAAGTSLMAVAERMVADGVARGAARVLPGSREFWRPLGHAAAIAAFGASARLLVEHAFRSIEQEETAMEAAFDVPPPNPLVSGSSASHVPFLSLSRQGRRFVWTVTTPEKIAEIFGEPVSAPIRVYAGLASGQDEAARAKVVVDELDRTGAFERSWLLVMSPTGSGYVNYAAVTAFELLARGDCATAAMQYAARPSVLSLSRVDQGRRQTRLLLDAIHERLAAIPEARRPKLVLFGESLGAWTSQDAFVDRGTHGLRDTGIDYAIWIGTPHFSKWKEQVLFDERADTDRSAIRVFNNIEEWRALDPAERERIRYVMITHHDDGVALFGPELAIQAPEWLGEPDTRPTSVPRSMRWMPTTAFFQVLIDMKNSATVVPGKFDAKGHDYRADLLPFLHGVLRFAATDIELERVNEWLARRELQRTEWLEVHGATGRSLAAAVIERAARELQEQGLDPDDRLAQLVRAVAEEEFGAGGGAGTADASAQ